MLSRVDASESSPVAQVCLLDLRLFVCPCEYLSRLGQPSSTVILEYASRSLQKSRCKVLEQTPAIPARQSHLEAHRSPRYARELRAAHYSFAPSETNRNSIDRPRHS